MNGALWDTVDWGDEDNSDAPHAQAIAIVSSPSFKRKETAATGRLSGSSAGSETVEAQTSSTPSTPERKVDTRRDERPWFVFDTDLSKLISLEDEEGSRSSGISQRKSSTRRNERNRRIGRRQSDYALEKQRVSEKRLASIEAKERRSLAERLLSSVGLMKKDVTASNDEGLNVLFPTANRRLTWNI
jgi:superfamily II DNA or RNA helicase